MRPRIPWRPPSHAVYAAGLLCCSLAGSPADADDVGFAPCSHVQPPTGAPPTARVVVTILSLRLNTDMEGDDDLIPGYDNRADVYGRVVIAGEEHELPKIDDDDHPHWDDHAAGTKSGRFVTQVSFTPDPTGMSPATVPVRIELFESDGGLTGDDDVVDVNPAPDKEAIDLELDVCRLRIDGDLEQEATQSVLVSSGGGGNDAGTLRFKVGLEDGRPVSIDDLALIEVDLIQVVPRTDRLVAGKPTVLVVRVANNYTVPRDPQLAVSITGATPQPLDEVFELGEIGPGEVKKFFFHLDDPLVFPELPQPYLASVVALLDPEQLFPDAGHAEPGDCRAANNGGDRHFWTVVPTRRPELLWAKVGADLDIGNFTPDSHFDELHDLGSAFIRATFPTDHVFDAASPVPIPMAVTPGFDWLRSIVPGNDVADPILMLADLNATAFLLGQGTIIGVLPNKDWFERFEGWETTSGLSLMDVVPKAILILPRIDTPAGFLPDSSVDETGPNMGAVAHEYGHTYGLSVDPALKERWQCEIALPVIGTLMCSMAAGFEEYAHEVFPYNKGNPAIGFWVPQGGEPAALQGIVGTEQCDSHCFMGTPLVNATDVDAQGDSNWDHRRSWIDATDYHHLLDRLQKNPAAQPIAGPAPAATDGLVFVSGIVALAGRVEADGATYEVLRDEVHLLDVLHLDASQVGDRQPDGFSAERAAVGVVRFVDDAGATLTEAPLPFHWPAIESSGAGPVRRLPVSFFGLSFRFPRGTRAIEVLRYDEYGALLPLGSRAVSARAPEVQIHPVESPRLTWSATDADGDALTFSVLARAAGERQWWPLATDLEERGLDVGALRVPPGAYEVKVVAHDGSHLTESSSEVLRIRGPRRGLSWVALLFALLLVLIRLTARLAPSSAPAA